ncbi:MBL fold metallo-hydrolase [Rhodopila sp.]|uniref:MBL fold metallo-hydrolase n=1 Tax=Rhodopila sp. TaxID=2480087 RepID=UPI002CE7EE19|nr:MBL fold metallo-hydrolase [Rhodopila sp.]HVZ08513.1 MBL fold metallo-hydrolase [Rhodopila sp.]
MSPDGRGASSDHFDGKRFFNPHGAGVRGLRDLLRWRFRGKREPWPPSLPSPFALDVPPSRVDGAAVRISFVGHATFLIQAGGLNLLTDPVWSERVSPFRFAGPSRYNPPGIDFADLPRIDAILLSHGHYDHMDLETLCRLWDRDQPHVITPLGHASVLRAGRSDYTVTEADWGDIIPLGGRARVTLVPAHHWTARWPWDRNKALWTGFVIEGLGGAIYFAGDTGFDNGRPFHHVMRRHGPPDLALLPIGAYEPRWFMGPQHMNPDDAVTAFRLLSARQALGYHWGTFRLTDEGPEQPAIDLAAALAAHGVAPNRFLPMRPGQVWHSGAVGSGDAVDADGGRAEIPLT